MEKEVIGLIAGGVSLLAYSIYIYKIWWGNTRPSRSSWWILSVVWLVVLLSSISLSPGETQEAQWMAVASRWLSVSYIIGSLAVAVSTIWRGSSEKWGGFDYFCITNAGIALVIYFFTNNAFASLSFGILADLFGLLPTIKNAWKFPQQEDLLAWAVTVVSCTLALFAVSDWSRTIESISDWIIPVYLFIANLIIVILITRKCLFYKKT